MSSISGLGSAPSLAVAGSSGTSQQQQQAMLGQLSKLKATDQQVRAHEEAHLAVVGPYAVSGPSYTYQKGPDGQLYAVGGEVSINDSPVANNPQATIQKERTVEAAANAPVDPSPQDHAVAMQAASYAEAAEVQLSSKTETGTGSYGVIPSQPGQLFSITL